MLKKRNGNYNFLYFLNSARVIFIPSNLYKSSKLFEDNGFAIKLFIIGFIFIFFSVGLNLFSGNDGTIERAFNSLGNGGGLTERDAFLALGKLLERDAFLALGVKGGGLTDRVAFLTVGITAVGVNGLLTRDFFNEFLFNFFP